MTRLLMLSLIALLLGCDTPKEETAGAMGNLMGSNTEGYAQVIKGKALSFPKDHQAHNDFRQEWWYLTANLTTESGEPLGVQWTQFRIALSPGSTESPLESASASSSWATNQLYMAHSALTTSDKHLTQERWSRGHPELAGTSTAPLTIKLDEWRWQSQGEQLFPAELQVVGDKMSYQLTLKSDAPFQLQGDQGYSIKNASGKVASYYYSQPFIEISGTVKIDGQTQKVTGKGWLDREWSSQFLDRHQQGWDWFALRLDDGSALMLFQLRTNTQEKPFFSARRMYPDGRGRNIESQAITMKATDWQQIGESSYPVSWQIAIPSEQLKLTISPLNPDSLMPLSVRYWEGPIQISGSHQGQGYMELTGY
ncbi:lipocalin-like domain-containing protein [Shewanella sp.]|uniref:lipocalin-like domain-containing protein n=1 Tax=Shewanella sp. TaxID=50422 RepID=UPI003D13C22F